MVAPPLLHVKHVTELQPNQLLLTDPLGTLPPLQLLAGILQWATADAAVQRNTARAADRHVEAPAGDIGAHVARHRKRRYAGQLPADADVSVLHTKKGGREGRYIGARIRHTSCMMQLLAYVDMCNSF